MAQKSFFKDLRRSIFRTKARFLSIVAIIALGVGFFAGINATEPDMILSADKYYQDHNLSDFRLVSPLGFKTDDISSVAAVEGVAQVQAGFSKDVFLASESGSTAIVRLYSYTAPEVSGQEALNIPVLTEGRMPEKSGEIAVESSLQVPDDIQIGSTIHISLPEDDELGDYLQQSTYTVVGRISSPLYIDFERGTTNIGEGSISFYAYIAQTDFAMEKATDLFVRTVESKKLTAYSDAYENHLTALQDTFEKLGQEIVAADTQLLRDELNQGKAELSANKEKAEQELADGELKLKDAEQAILDGEQELKDTESYYTRVFATQSSQLKKGQADLEAGWKLYNKNLAQWQAGYDSYESNLAQLASVKVQLDGAMAQITQAEADLATAKSGLDAAKAQLDSLQAAIVGLTSIRQSLPDIVPGISEAGFSQLVEDTRVYSGDLADSIEKNFHYDDPNLLDGLIPVYEAAIAQMGSSLDTAQAEYDSGLAEYEAGLSRLTGQKSAYEQGLAEYESSMTALEAAKTQLDSSLAELENARATLEETEVSLTAGEKALARGKADLKRKLADGQAELADARTKLAEGRADYEKEKADALAEIAEAEVKIRDSEREILEIPDNWFVLTRASNPGYTGYGDDARRIGAVAKVFPLFFFLVAALVCLTTMTRMVEEERVQIGTLKALGYSTLKISTKYLVYALLASVTGAATGLAVGFRLFPGVIMQAYGMMYQIPERLMPDHLGYALISILIAVATTVAAALLATLQELRATPAVLMQPKAPKPGKRILLERIRPLWKRLSFSHKVTARNIFRYKSRFLMTVIGIAGCTALLVTGFGLRDSINAIMDKQFGEIFLYDGLLMVDTEKTGAGQDAAGLLTGNSAVASCLNADNETVTVLGAKSTREFEATLIVPQDKVLFPEFYDLHVRTTGEKLTLPDDGAIISEKLAQLLGVQSGDTISWRDAEQRTYEIRVSGITENYLLHYIYLSPVYYDQVTLRTPQYNSALFNLKDETSVDQKIFKEDLMGGSGVLAVMFTSGLADKFSDSLGSLDYVVFVLIFASGALAFVVLYNLTNININERLREIATIKVLGFRDREVSAYVYRENVILTVIGTLAGLVLGFTLHRFVMGTMEIDNMMFGKNVHLLSYLLSVALTLAFSMLVNFFMYYHLRKISMVESLKSVE